MPNLAKRRIGILRRFRQNQLRKKVTENSVRIGHGWGTQLDLAEKLWVRTLTLNDQYLLDTPATYKLTWSGRRLARKSSLRR